MKKLLMAFVVALVLGLTTATGAKALGYTYVLDYCKNTDGSNARFVLYSQAGQSGSVTRTYYTTGVPSLRVKLGVKSWLYGVLVSDTLHQVCNADITVR